MSGPRVLVSQCQGSAEIDCEPVSAMDVVKTNIFEEAKILLLPVFKFMIPDPKIQLLKPELAI